MPSLSIRIDARSDASVGAVGLLAELDRLEPRGGAERLTRKVSISTGAERLVEDLAPGRWEVRVITPSGRTLAQEVLVQDGAVATADFILEPARSDRRSRGIGGVPVRAPDGPPVGIRLTRGLAPTGPARSHGFADALGADRPSSLANPAPELFSVPAPARRDGTQARAFWAQLADTLSRGAVPRFLWVGAQATPVLEAALGGEAGGFELAVRPGCRGWALLAVGGVLRLHAVPAPWRVEGPAVKVVLAAAADAAASRIVVLDPAYAGLLDYLAAGSLAAAADLLRVDDELAPYTKEGATGLLREKGASPLGACAAAYALLGSAVPGEDARWHGWIENLSLSFGWLPDGAVLLARLRLMQACSETDVDAALPIVLDALGRGVPYYRQGFDWLLQAMLQFDDEPAVREALPFVREVAAALDMTQVFTTVRL